MPGGWPPGQRMTGRGDTRGTVPNIDKKNRASQIPEYGIDDSLCGI